MLNAEKQHDLQEIALQEHAIVGAREISAYNIQGTFLDVRL
jgi:hypothetical protein